MRARLPSTGPTLLACAATTTAICLSALAGWQRGGWLPERLLWVAIGVVLVVACHLLPALCRAVPWPLRCVGCLLWEACTLATCYGHATFFLFSQQHAGALRADAVTVPASIDATGRDLGAIAADRAELVADLGQPGTRRAVIRARLDALDAEASETRRREAAADRLQAQQDRVGSRRDDLRADPVTGRLAGWLGVQRSRLDLLTGLLMAAVLEGVACFCWVLALDSGKQPHERSSRETTPCKSDAPRHESEGIAIRDPLPVDVGAALDSDPVTLAVTEAVAGDRERVAAEIAAGRVRCTVADIRRFLGCSQTRAMALRRELAGEGELA